MSESLFVARYRIFETDFNQPNDRLLCSVSWWKDPPEIGEEVLLTDGDWDLTKGHVVKVNVAPDKELRKDGIFTCRSSYSPWLDGASVLTLALDYLEQQTRADLIERVELG